jgi:hypothetical protein
MKETAEDQTHYCPECEGLLKEEKMSWIVKLQNEEKTACAFWLAPWSGDPGRTTVEASAKRFATAHAARCALGKARRFSPFRDARVCQVDDARSLRRIEEGNREAK